MADSNEDPKKETQEYQYDEPCREVPMQIDEYGNRYWCSMHTPVGFPVRALCKVPEDLPGVIILVHGVNSEGEWFEDMEKGLCAGLNTRLNRHDLKENAYTTQPKTSQADDSKIVDKLSVRRIDSTKHLGNSPIIRFYWGYSAPAGDEKKYRVAMRNLEGDDPWVAPDRALSRGPFYWGGGPFANGTTDLPGLWSNDGFTKKVAKVVSLELINDMVDRPLENAPPRYYYAHAVERLAKLINKIRKKNPEDTITLISHSQGTMVAMAAALMCNKPGVDALFVMNSPYRLEDKTIDLAQWGWERSITKARRNTFEAVAKRLKEDQETLKTYRTQGCLNVGSAPDKKALWSDSIIGANDIAERNNHGRMYVYFNPHDRVMGMTALQSTGWQGIPKDMFKDHPNLFQRMLARSTPCGDEPGEYPFGTLPLAYPAKMDKPGMSPGVEKPSKPDSFWNGNLKLLRGVGGDLWATPEPAKTVYINAEKVPVPLTAQELEIFDKSPDGEPLLGQLEDGNPDPDFPLLANSIAPQLNAVKNDPHEPHRVHAVSEGIEKKNARLQSYRPFPTNHSTLPQHEKFIKQVVTYDIPIGFCHSGNDANFWAELMEAADWTRSDNYWFTGTGVDAKNKPPMPPEIDTETITSAELKKQADRNVIAGA